MSTSLSTNDPTQTFLTFPVPCCPPFILWGFPQLHTGDCVHHEQNGWKGTWARWWRVGEKKIHTRDVLSLWKFDIPVSHIVLFLLFGGMAAPCWWVWKEYTGHLASFFPWVSVCPQWGYHLSAPLLKASPCLPSPHPWYALLVLVKCCLWYSE